MNVNNMLQACIKQFRLLMGRALRESGQALDRTGSRMTNDIAFYERYSRHRKLLPLDHIWPTHGDSFVAPNACLTGEVSVGNNCAIWYGTTMRADGNPIRLADNVSVGENTSMNTVIDLPRALPGSINIASNVVIGDCCSLYSCTIDSWVRVERSCFIEPGARIEEGAVILNGTVVPAGNNIPAYTVWQGNPAQFIRDATPEDIALTKEMVTKNSLAGKEHEQLLS